MRPLTAEDEATLRAIAERHGFYAARGPHTGEGSASRLIDALLAGEIVTLALTPADRRRLVTWLDELPPPEGRLAIVLRSLAAQLRPTLPATAAPRASAASSSQIDAPAIGVRPDMEPDNLRRIDVELWLRVENNSKFVRGKTKARAWIEDTVLRRYDMHKPYANRSDYILTLSYDTDEELDALVDDLLREAGQIADLHDCFIEADVRALDGSDRSW
jgi:hypothetical protein